LPQQLMNGASSYGPYSIFILQELQIDIYEQSLNSRV